VQASPGDIEAVFVGALESEELRLGKGSANLVMYTEAWAELQEVDDRITALQAHAYDGAVTDADKMTRADISKLLAARARLADALRNPPSTAGTPAVQVWYSPDDFPGWAMFTWPDLARGGAGCATEVCLCTDARTLRQTQTFRGGEYAGFPLQPLLGFRLRLDGQNPGLTISYEGLDTAGKELPADASGWVSAPDGMMGFQVRLTGAASSDHEVRYTGRFLRIGGDAPFILDGPSAVDGDPCNLTDYLGKIDLGHFPWPQFVKGARFVLQGIQVSVVRKACTASLPGGTIRLVGEAWSDWVRAPVAETDPVDR
jgi:hypothetical protein